MKIAEMRHRVKIQRQVQTADGVGGFTHTWETFKDVSAAIWPVSSKEIRENMRTATLVTHNFRVRYTAGILAEMRILYKSRVFEINLPINFEERNIWLDLVCYERY